MYPFSDAQANDGDQDERSDDYDVRSGYDPRALGYRSGIASRCIP